MIKDSKYLFSKDYGRLLKLLDGEETVICKAVIKFDGIKYSDICVGKKVGDEYKFFAWGIDYCTYRPDYSKKYADYPKTFEEMMALHEIAFIDI